MPRKQESGSASAARTLASSASNVAQTQAQLTQAREGELSQQRSQNAQMFSQGMSMTQQDQQFQQQTKLQAAERDLEYDPEKKIYRPTQARQDREQLAMDQQRQQMGIAQRNEARANAKLGLEAQEMQARKGQVAHQQRVSEASARTAAMNAETARMRESRMLQEARLKGEESYREQETKVNERFRSDIKNVNSRMDKVISGQLDSGVFDSLEQKLLQSENPDYAALAQGIKNRGEGPATAQERQRVLDSLKAERDKLYIMQAAETGDFEALEFSSPVMQKYLIHHATVQQSLNSVTQMQMQAMQAMGGAANFKMFGGNRRDREKMTHRLAARMFLANEFYNAERAAVSRAAAENQSNVNTGGAAPAVTGGPQELSRRRSAQQPQQQPGQQRVDPSANPWRLGYRN